MSSPSRPLAALRFFFLVVCVLETNFLRSRPAEVLATEPVATTGQAAELIWNFDADGPPAQGVVTEAVGQLRIAECGPTGDLFIGLPPRNRPCVWKPPALIYGSRTTHCTDLWILNKGIRLRWKPGSGPNLLPMAGTCM
jgi:hypothetical protein